MGQQIDRDAGNLETMKSFAYTRICALMREYVIFTSLDKHARSANPSFKFVYKIGGYFIIIIMKRIQFGEKFKTAKSGKGKLYNNSTGISCCSVFHFEEANVP